MRLPRPWRPSLTATGQEGRSGDYQTSDKEESEDELKDDGVEEVDEELGEGQWEELDENGKVIVVGTPDAVPPTDGMTEEEVADTVMKGDERFDVLTQRHRIAFGNVIAKYVSRDWWEGGPPCTLAAAND